MATTGTARNQTRNTTNQILKPNVTRLFAISSNPASRQSPFFAKYHLLRVPPHTTPNEHGLLGEGAFSVCFRCFHRRTGVEYAVKILRRQQRSESIRKYLNESLPREINMLRRCQGHRNIVKLKEVIIDSVHIYIVTQLLRGASLSLHILQHRSSFPEDKAKAVFRQLLSALEYMHSKGVVHRDLKPDNVIFVDGISDSVKLIDFGFARSYDGTLMSTPRCTFNYAAPEVLHQFIVRKAPNLLKEENASLYRTDGYDSSCDLWSLGAILLHILTGDDLFRGIETQNIPAAVYANTILEQMVAGEAFQSVQSAAANSLLAGLLAVHPANRMTIEQAKEHPWLVEADDQRDKAAD